MKLLEERVETSESALPGPDGGRDKVGLCFLCMWQAAGERETEPTGRGPAWAEFITRTDLSDTADRIAVDRDRNIKNISLPAFRPSSLHISVEGVPGATLLAGLLLRMNFRSCYSVS